MQIICKDLKIILMGVCGCGKTTIAELLAKKLDCPVLEADQYHTPEMKAKMRESIPLNDEDRWPWLDRMRAALIESADQKAIATCSALRKTYRQYLTSGELAGRVLFVFLDAPQELIAERIAKRQHEFMPASLLPSQFATLERPENDEPVITIDVSLPVEQVLEEIIRQVC